MRRRCGADSCRGRTRVTGACVRRWRWASLVKRRRRRQCRRGPLRLARCFQTQPCMPLRCLRLQALPVPHLTASSTRANRPLSLESLTIENTLSEMAISSELHHHILMPKRPQLRPLVTVMPLLDIIARVWSQPLVLQWTYPHRTVASVRMPSLLETTLPFSRSVPSETVRGAGGRAAHHTNIHTHYYT